MGKGKHKAGTPYTNRGFTSDDFRAVCAAAGNAYRLGDYSGNNLPTVEDIKLLCDRTVGVIAKVLATEEFISAMAERGIRWKKAEGLTAKQNVALSILTNPYDRRPFQVRLRDARISHIEYTAWMKNPLFRTVIEQFAEAAIRDHMSQAHNSLIQKVEDGDMRALEFYYAMTGRYNPASQSERNIQEVLGQVLEVITKHVTDGEILGAIADDMQAIMRGDKPKADLPEITAQVVEEEIEEKDQWIPGGAVSMNGNLGEFLDNGGAQPEPLIRRPVASFTPREEPPVVPEFRLE